MILLGNNMLRNFGACLVVLTSGAVAACGNAGPTSFGQTSAVPTAVKQQVSGVEIPGVIEGKTFSWIRARDHASGQTTFATGGKMTWKRLDVDSSGAGSWQVEGETLCQTFDPTPTWKGGRVCRKIFQQGTTLTTSPNDGGLVTYTPTT